MGSTLKKQLSIVCKLLQDMAHAMTHETELPEIYDHAAVRLQDCIVVFGDIDHKTGKELRNAIYVYNLYTDQWRKHIIPKHKILPSKMMGRCAEAIGSDIYVFSTPKYDMGGLWKLVRKGNKGCFSWSEVSVNKIPLHRYDMTGWEYAEKLWIFGGVGPSPVDVGQLNNFVDFILLPNGDGVNNQLLCFDPSCQEWNNVKSFGAVPSPRRHHSSAIMNDKVLLRGGLDNSEILNDLYELGMHNLTCTEIKTTQPEPSLSYFCSMNAIAGNKLVFHDVVDSTPKKMITWILDVTSLS